MVSSELQNGDVPGLRKGLHVLDLLARHDGLTMAEIQRHSGLNKTMAFRILRTLREQGYVRHDAKTHRFTPSFKLMELGASVAAQLNVVKTGQPFLEELRLSFGETANLAVLEDDAVVYVGIAESSYRGLRMSSRVGGRDHLHSTSVGKAILAFLPDERRDDILNRLELPAITPNTITNRSQLQEEILRTRERGFAIDNGENEDGARCVGVPILEREGAPIAAISISAPNGRINDDLVVRIADALWSTSEEISQQLGYNIPAHSLQSPSRAEAVDQGRTEVKRD